MTIGLNKAIVGAIEVLHGNEGRTFVSCDPITWYQRSSRLERIRRFRRMQINGKLWHSDHIDNDVSTIALSNHSVRSPCTLHSTRSTNSLAIGRMAFAISVFETCYLRPNSSDHNSFCRKKSKNYLSNRALPTLLYFDEGKGKRPEKLLEKRRSRKKRQSLEVRVWNWRHVLPAAATTEAVGSRLAFPSIPGGAVDTDQLTPVICKRTRLTNVYVASHLIIMWRCRITIIQVRPFWDDGTGCRIVVWLILTMTTITTNRPYLKMSFIYSEVNIHRIVK